MVFKTYSPKHNWKSRLINPFQKEAIGLLQLVSYTTKNKAEAILSWLPQDDSIHLHQAIWLSNCIL